MVKRFITSDEQLEELIHQFCRNYTDLEREGRFDPITGRDDEITQTILILMQKGRKNCCYLAPAGVGKTALVVGLAQQVVKGEVPDYLKDARVLEIDLASVAAGTNDASEFQGRLIPLIRGVAERNHDPNYPKFILFIDELHTIMPTAVGSGYRGLSEVLKPYLTVGDLHVLGATTIDEYRMHVAEDPALDRRFQKIHLRVPTPEETMVILNALRPGLEKHHQISIPDNCLQLVIDLTEEHMKRRNQPDKSIIMVDAACAYYVLHNGRGGELDKDSVKYMIGKEAKLNPKALVG